MSPFITPGPANPYSITHPPCPDSDHHFPFFPTSFFPCLSVSKRWWKGGHNWKGLTKNKKIWESPNRSVSFIKGSKFYGSSIFRRFWYEVWDKYFLLSNPGDIYSFDFQTDNLRCKFLSFRVKGVPANHVGTLRPHVEIPQVSAQSRASRRQESHTGSLES